MSIARLFQNTFGSTPDVTTATPGRVNLIGEHIDYNGGTVLPAAIDRRLHVAFGVSNENYDEIHSDNFDATVKAPLKARKKNKWSDYAAGALHAAREKGLFERGVRVAIKSDIPYGAGLSSSAALIVGVLRAAYQFAGIAVTATDLALLAQKVENEFIGVPCGVMDHFAVAGAEQGYALAFNTQDLAHCSIALPSAYHFAVVHSGIQRMLNDGRYAERRQECVQAREALHAYYLCRLNEEQERQIDTLPPPLQRRARHAVDEQRRVMRAIEALRKGDMIAFGTFMNEGHQSLRENFEVSTPEIDALVAGAREAGSVGARLTGGGFGGCIVACVSKDELPAWRLQLEREFPNARHIC